ncbi:cation:proton antiporter [Paenibacillus caui]|uniref:cation:proton antiporter n=1 Tax=Paenibacillus caui TaxID=2873927 RepID=UPI001CA8A0B3|nr:cation:proton antiporter [Paenibacillus caui]
MEFILSLSIIMLFTKLAGDLSVRLSQPSVLGKLIAGIILGPAVLGWVHNGEFIEYFSEIGVLLLMFMAGLETDLKQLQSNWKTALAVAIGGIITPLICGYAASMALGLGSSQGLFLGLLLCATSVSISVQTLKEMGKLNTRESTSILGAAVLDDVIVVVLLAFMLSFLGAESDVSLGMIAAKKLLFFIIAIAAAWLVVPRLLKLFGKLQVTETVITAGLIVCFALSYFAESMGVAGIIGAFIAGIAVSQTEFKHTVESKIEPVAYAVFVPVFFVSIGLNVSFEGVGSQIGLIVLLTVVAILTKLVGGGLGARLTGFDNRSALVIGSGMVSRGEVALIIAATGLSSGLLAPEYFTAVVIVVILTTLVTPPMLKWAFAMQRSSEELRNGREQI